MMTYKTEGKPRVERRSSIVFHFQEQLYRKSIVEHIEHSLIQLMIDLQFCLAY
jgi:hypothetical protein